MPSRYNQKNFQLVLPFHELKFAVKDYIGPLQEYGIDIHHLVGFAGHALGEQQYHHHPLRMLGPDSYLAYEMATINPHLTSDRSLFTRLVGIAASAIEIISGAIYGKLRTAFHDQGEVVRVLMVNVQHSAAIFNVSVMPYPTNFKMLGQQLAPDEMTALR